MAPLAQSANMKQITGNTLQVRVTAQRLPLVELQARWFLRASIIGDWSPPRISRLPTHVMYKYLLNYSSVTLKRDVQTVPKTMLTCILANYTVRSMLELICTCMIFWKWWYLFSVSRRKRPVHISRIDFLEDLKFCWLIGLLNK